MTFISIPGRPVPKKNSPLMLPKIHKILPSKTFREYEKHCLRVLLQWGNICYRERVWLKCQYWLPDKRWYPDLVGLLQGTSDILEKAGIIQNDRLIVSYDGSRIMGFDKEYPRVEITIQNITGKLEYMQGNEIKQFTFEEIINCALKGGE